MACSLLRRPVIRLLTAILGHAPKNVTGLGNAGFDDGAAQQ
jgi:hypothetical protein